MNALNCNVNLPRLFLSRKQSLLHFSKIKKQKPPVIDGFMLKIVFFLTTSHAVPAIQAFVTSAAADGNMPAGITSRRITLHIFGGGIYSIIATVNFFRMLSSVWLLYHSLIQLPLLRSTPAHDLQW